MVFHNWFGFFVLAFIIVLGTYVLRAKPHKRRKRKSSFWSKYGYNAQRDTPEYFEWREKVIKKIKKCVVCGTVEHLHCHHIVPFALSRWKRYRVSNGTLLCEHHHSLYHNEYELKDCNLKTLKEFVRKYRKKEK